MTQFKGTKGKWEVSKAYETIIDEEGYGIAQEYGIKNSLYWKANALLISKAPELLEMLEEVKDYLGSDVRGKVEQLIKEATEL
jgi:uncharacterized secreted protein with C-terminal beta-propeller domain